MYHTDIYIMNDNQLNSFDEFLNEASRQTPDQVDSLKRKKIKAAADAAKDYMKAKPEKAGYYRARLAYFSAKLKMLDAYKKMLKERD